MHEDKRWQTLQRGTDLIALLDHHLLCKKDLLGGNLHSQVPPSNHDGVGFLQDVIKVLDAFLILHLADDFDLSALGSQNLKQVTVCHVLLPALAGVEMPTFADPRANVGILGKPAVSLVASIRPPHTSAYYSN